MRTRTEKINTVIEKNTYYFFNSSFEEQNEIYLNSILQTLLLLKNEIEINGLRKEVFYELLAKKESGLPAILALTGLSNENLKRLITLIRIVDDKELSQLTFKSYWSSENLCENIKEWSDIKIKNMFETNEYFRKGIINIFFEGATIPLLVKTVPPFELKKLSISKLNFEVPSMIDTLIRYREKGSYSGKKGNNPENIISDIINKFRIDFCSGDLSELINIPNKKRKMDFIIPNKVEPMIIIECSFLATTSSGQGDKAKTEISISELIKNHYPSAKFVGFLDGIGWYVRKNDLNRMIEAYDDVFTFHKTELLRFEALLKEVFYI